MKRTTRIWLVATVAILSFAMVQHASAASKRVIATPAEGVTYTWHVLESNGQVMWLTNSWNVLGNIVIVEAGVLNYTLTGQHPNDEFTSNITGNVWYGDFFTSGNASFLYSNVSITEAGYNLALSVQVWAGCNALVAWSPGFIASTNWTENTAILTAPGISNITVRDFATVYAVFYNSSFQNTHLEYDKATGVLRYASTQVGDFYMVIQLDWYPGLPAIPGYPVELVLAACLPVIALVASSIKKKER